MKCLYNIVGPGSEGIVRVGSHGHRTVSVATLSRDLGCRAGDLSDDLAEPKNKSIFSSNLNYIPTSEIFVEI